MSDFYEMPKMGGTMGEIFTATAASITAAGVSLQFAGQSGPTRKSYKSLSSAVISTCDQVLCARISGTIIVLGRIGLAENPGDGFLFVPLGSTGLLTREGAQFISRRE